MFEEKIRFYISEDVRRKLKEKHGVEPEQVKACFFNREGCYLVDVREEHKTEPPTRWFISQDDRGKLLKVCFIYFAAEKAYEIKTAYPPNQLEVTIYATAQMRVSNEQAAIKDEQQ